MGDDPWASASQRRVRENGLKQRQRVRVAYVAVLALLVVFLMFVHPAAGVAGMLMLLTALHPPA